MEEVHTVEKSEKNSKLRTILANIFSKNDTLRDELTDFFEEQDIPLSNDQLQMILAIVRMLGFDANKIKVPANRMISLPLGATLKESIQVIKKSGHSRIPVYQEKDKQKDFVGILYAKDLLPSLIKKEGRFKLADYLHKHYVVPETQGLLSLLRDMRLKKQHLALTVNEHGDVSGLITLEDILEEIVGEIRDEFDSEKLQIKEIGLRTYRIDASLPLSDVNKQLAINLPEEKFNTLAGFVLHELKGSLRKRARVNYGKLEITLESYSNQQIKTVIVKIPANSAVK